MQIKDITIQGRVVRGCPQGGVLSPIIWNLVMDSLLSSLNNIGLYSLGYADDLLILLVGHSEDTLCELMRSAFRIVETWCKDSGLSVNPSKTELVLFTNKRKLPNLRLPTLCGTTLSLSGEAKYLGVILDKKLNWTKHLEQKAKKAMVSLWQCKRTIGKSWGFSPKITNWIYVAVVRPMLSYCATVWWHKTNQKTALGKLQKVQRTACLAITGAIRTTPTAALEVLSGLTPLDLYLEGVAGTASLRLDRSGLWKTRMGLKGHGQALERLLSKEPETGMPTDGIPKTIIFVKPFQISIGSGQEVESDGAPNLIDVYTDGSNNGYRTGAGVFSESLDIELSIPMGEYATVFQAEVYAILVATNKLLGLGLENKQIRFFSDSQAALKALNSFLFTSGLVYDCLRALHELCEQNNVRLEWVRGHSGVEGNERADKLAKIGTEMAIQSPEPFLGLSVRSLKLKQETSMRQRHAVKWLAKTGCRQTKTLIKGPSKSISKILISTPRTKVRKLTAFLTGHGDFRKHMFRLGLAESPTCRYCNEQPETAEHILSKCPAVSSKRMSTFGFRVNSVLNIKDFPVNLILKFIDLLEW